MERYELIKVVGEGTFGRVIQAKKKKDSTSSGENEMVAIKRIKRKFSSSYSSWHQLCRSTEFMRNIHHEVRSLTKMNHPNIVKLQELIFENGELSLVFEWMECNLYQIMHARQEMMSLRPNFSETEIKHWCVQLFSGLAHMHQRGYFHRDLKPEKLLVKQDIIKIADLGLAREIHGSTPPYTARVGTLWYRAPEVLLGTGFYDSKVDMWAMGAIMAEMFTGRPLFPGTSELDQLNRICRFTGPECAYDTDMMGKVIPNASDEAISLMESLCSWDPRYRPTASQALQHPFFQPPPRQVVPPPPRRKSFPNAVAAKGPPPGFESSRPRMPQHHVHQAAC